MISTTDLSSYSLDKSHIEYSMVTEKFEDGSSVVYKFSDYIQYPDIYKITYRGYLDKNYICSYPAEANSLLAAPNNIVSQRGRLLETHYYNTQGQMVRQDKTTYQRLDSLENPKYIVYAKPAVTNLFEQKIIADSGPVKSVTTIDILPSISLIKTSKAFIYNALGQKAGIYQTNSDGSTVCDSTAYVSDIPFSMRTVVHGQMLQNNKLNAPIASIRKMKKAGSATETVVKSDTYEYMRHPSVAKLNPLKNIQSVQPGLSYENELQSHQIVSYDLYDKQGRVLQVTDKNNVSICYVWGYKGLYPVAKILNAKYESVKNCGLYTSEDNPLAGGLSQSIADRLRSLNGAEVTVYDYEPFVGVTRVEDPSGRVTSYFYKKSGKLSSIKDDKGYIVKEFQYSIN